MPASDHPKGAPYWAARLRQGPTPRWASRFPLVVRTSSIASMSRSLSDEKSARVPPDVVMTAARSAGPNFWTARRATDLAIARRRAENANCTSSNTISRIRPASGRSFDAKADPERFAGAVVGWSGPSRQVDRYERRHGHRRAVFEHFKIFLAQSTYQFPGLVHRHDVDFDDRDLALEYGARRRGLLRGVHQRDRTNHKPAQGKRVASVPGSAAVGRDRRRDRAWRL